MKKLLLFVSLLALTTMTYADKLCFQVTGSIRTIKVYYDANKRVLYEEEQGSQYYSRDIEANSQEEAKRIAMQECESMCYSTDAPKEIIENGKTVGYYRLMRRTEITNCTQSYGCR